MSRPFDNEPGASADDRRARGPGELDALWQGVREGDGRSARLLIEYLLAEGNDEGVQAAQRAISRHFRRQAQSLARKARLASGRSRRALTDEAIRAFAKGLVGEHLPQLVRDALSHAAAVGADESLPQTTLPDVLPPPTDLEATGRDRSVDLTWTNPAGFVLDGKVVKVYDAGGDPLLETELLPAEPGYTVSNLENGKSYLFVVQLLGALGTTSSANVTGTAGEINDGLPAPEGLTAAGVDHGLEFSWNKPVLPDGTSITQYLLTLSGDGLVQTAGVPASAAEAYSYTFTGLQNGHVYGLSAQPLGTVGAATDQLGDVAQVEGVAGRVGEPFVPRLPQLPTDPLLLLDPGLFAAVVRPKRLLTQANAIGQKWHFDYLKEQAARAARDAMAFDRQIMDLMSMTLNKGAAAGSISTSAFLSTIGTIQGNTEKISGAAHSVPVVEAMQELSDAVTALLVIAAVLEWLATTDAFEVWRDFFDALIEDVSEADTSLSKVKKFIDRQYESGPLGAGVRARVQEELGVLQAEISNLVAPLRVAVAQLVGDTNEAMTEVFKSFDLPLLMAATPEGDLPNVNPLTKSLQDLTEAVAQLERELQSLIEETLLEVVDKEAKAIFRSLMIAYFVTPLVAALSVTLAGGPIAAGLLAGIVAVAAEELLHLIARWLSGPLDDVLDELDQDVSDATTGLQRAFAEVVPVGSITSPVDKLTLLEYELRQLRDLMPQAFLDDVACILAEARDLAVSGGVVQGLAAERAVGFGNATAFDRIRYAYENHFTPAEQMPGGTDRGLFAGAALLRDLNRLEQDVTRLTDGKEVEVTRRLSLFQLLGGTGDPVTATGLALGRFADFLRNGQAVVELRPDTLLDSSTPGVYRALIKDVRVFGFTKVPAANNPLLNGGLAVTLTHSGQSRTRIRRDSNPAAPPVALPPGYPDRTAYTLAMSYSPPKLEWPVGDKFIEANSVEGKVWSIVSQLPGPLDWSAVRKACLDQLPAAVSELGNVVTVGRASASASSSIAGHEPECAIDGDPDTYYSSETFSESVQGWFSVQLSQPSSVITGLKLRPRAGGTGLPGTLQIQVAHADVDAAYRDIPARLISSGTAGGAHYYHFAPVSGRYIRITMALPGSGTVHVLQLSEVEIEVMNVTLQPLSFDTATSSQTLSGHPVALLIDDDPQRGTYYSSKYFYQMPTPPVAEAPEFEVGFRAPQVVDLFRLYPRTDSPGDFPKIFSFQLWGAHAAPSYHARYEGYGIFEHDPQDFPLPRQSVSRLHFRAEELVLVKSGFGFVWYALQFAHIEAFGFIPQPAPVNAGPMGDAVEAILREMPWPPPALSLDPVGISVAVAEALLKGVPERGIPGLSSAAGVAYDAARSEAMGHIAKWGDISQDEDPDPNVRGLRYLDLTRKLGPEAATFDLFPAENGGGQVGTYLRARPDIVPSGLPQYRPFENLGIGGQLQVDAPQAAALLLADLVVEITMRGCFDPDLASTVRAGQQQRDDQLAQLTGIEASTGRVLAPGAPAVSLGSGGLKTVQFSLRAHRDRILQAALAGAQLEQDTTDPIEVPVTVSGLTFTPATTEALRLTDAFSFFGGADADSITLTFARDATPTLKDQLSEIVVRPATLGVDLDLLDSGLPPSGSQPGAALEGIAVAIIPTRVAARSLAPTVDAIDAALQPLVGWMQGQSITSRLTMTSPPQAAAGKVSLGNLWPAAPGASRLLRLDFASAIDAGHVYDVVFSLSFRMPTLVGGTTSPDLF